MIIVGHNARTDATTKTTARLAEEAQETTIGALLR